MQSIAVVSQKGGVGKTTISLNLAYSFARRGHRTLVVDYDLQGGIGLSLRGGMPAEDGLLGWIYQGTTLDNILVSTRLPNLSLLPMGHTSVERYQESSQRFALGGDLRRLLSECASRFDVVLVDTPGGLVGATQGALLATDSCLVPVQAEPLSLRTLPRTLEMIASVRRQGAGSTLAGVVVSMGNVTEEIGAAVMQELWTELPSDIVLDTVIPKDKNFLAASAAGVPVGLLRKRPPPVALIFERLAAELELRLGLHEEGEDDEPINLLG